MVTYIEYALFRAEIGLQRAQAPTFNIMVAGPKDVGKTSFLKTLLATTEISALPGPAYDDLQRKVDAFGRRNGVLNSTLSMDSITLEVSEQEERVLLTLVDTPGFDHQGELKSGREDVRLTLRRSDRYRAGHQYQLAAH